MVGKMATTRLLLVEDTPFLRAIFGRLLRLQGFEVNEVNDGQEALECLADFRPNLVLTDMMMPRMNGVELISELRARPETAELPVLAITADGSGQAESEARRAGASDFILKPVDLPELLARINRLVPQRGTGAMTAACG